MNTLDNILGGGEAVPEKEKENEQVAPKVDADAGLTPNNSDQPDLIADQPEGGPQRQNMVPHEALNAEKQKVKRYTEEVADFRRSNEALTRQVSELLQRVPVPKQEQQQPPDFFENPQAATRHELTQAVTPEFERINQSLLAFAKDNAITRFTEEKVNEAEQAFVSAVQNRTLDPSDYQRVVSSPNRYAEAVKWHQRQLAQAEIGDDPAAFKAKVEAELREKLLAELNPGNGQPAQQRQPGVTPSNLAGARNVGARSGPAWSGPTPLTDIFKH